MNTNIILSVIGPDKSGIVSDISKIVKNYSGNIEKSRMVRLGNFFTIMVLITINENNIDSLNKEFNNYSDYQISIHKLKNNLKDDDLGSNTHTIHLNGFDNEGLVYRMTTELAKLDINIEELETSITNAPMSGLTLFSLEAKISHPKLNYDILKKKMDNLASKLDINILLED